MTEITREQMVEWLEGQTPMHERRGQYYAICAALTEKALPLDMVLHCPKCHAQHIDRDEWATRPHKTHLCEHCGNLWRPCQQPTCGVEALSAAKDGAG